MQVTQMSFPHLTWQYALDKPTDSRASYNNSKTTYYNKLSTVVRTHVSITICARAVTMQSFDGVLNMIRLLLPHERRASSTS